jgi:hypothetical protein
MMVVTIISLIAMLFCMLLGKFPESAWFERLGATLILTFLSAFFFLAANPSEKKDEDSPHK